MQAVFESPSGEAPRPVLHREICATIGHVGALWPKAERAVKTGSQLKPGRKKKAAVLASNPHQWANCRGMLHCSQCKAFATSQKAIQKRAGEECPGLCPKIPHLIAVPLGPLLCATQSSDGEGIFFCARCAAYAISSPKCLKQECRGGSAKRYSAGYHNLQWLAAGRHPVNACKATTTGTAEPLDAQP